MDLQTCLRPFAESPYAIRDDDFAETGDVIISSADGLIPRLGDRFTVMNAGAPHEVVVYSLTISRDGWRVICRLDAS